jgi:hypothetical protein
MATTLHIQVVLDAVATAAEPRDPHAGFAVDRIDGVRRLDRGSRTNSAIRRSPTGAHPPQGNKQIRACRFRRKVIAVWSRSEDRVGVAQKQAATTAVSGALFFVFGPEQLNWRRS